MREPKKVLWVREADLKLAKSISAMKGMTLYDYFGDRVQEDMKTLEREVAIMKQKKELEQPKRGNHFAPPF